MMIKTSIKTSHERKKIWKLIIVGLSYKVPIMLFSAVLSFRRSFFLTKLADYKLELLRQLRTQSM